MLYVLGRIDLALSAGMCGRRRLKNLREVDCCGNQALFLVRAEPELRWSSFVMALPLVYLDLNKHSEIVTFYEDIGLSTGAPELFATWQQNGGQMFKFMHPDFIYTNWYLLQCLGHQEMRQHQRADGTVAAPSIPDIEHLQDMDSHSIPYTAGAGSVLNLAARVYMMREDHEMAMECLRRSLALHRQPFVLLQAHLLMGRIVQKASGPEPAVHHYLESARMASSYGFYFMALMAGAECKHCPRP